jgi:hypothetical protein
MIRHRVPFEKDVEAVSRLYAAQPKIL